MNPMKNRPHERVAVVRPCSDKVRTIKLANVKQTLEIKSERAASFGIKPTYLAARDLDKGLPTPGTGTHRILCDDSAGIFGRGTLNRVKTTEYFKGVDLIQAQTLG